MAIARGINTIVAYRKEATWGVLPGTGSGKQLRRTNAEFNLTKETYQSEEIRTDYQMADFRHGIISAEGRVSGELSCATYADFMQSIVGRDFVAFAGATFDGTVAANNVLTAATANPINLGFKSGMIVRLTAGPNAENLNINLLISDVTATSLRFVRLPLGSPNLTVNAVTASYTVSMFGKETYIPQTGHTDDSYSIEKWYSAAPQSETYSGLKVNTMNIQVPSSGISTIETTFLGASLSRVASTAYFVSPAAMNTNSLLVASSAVVRIAPITAGTLTPITTQLTNFSMTINRNMAPAEAIGSSSIVDIMDGRIMVEGEMSVYYNEFQTLRDYFADEAEFSVQIILQTTLSATANCLSFMLPTCKLVSRSVADAEDGVITTYAYQATLPGTTVGGVLVDTQRSTIVIQDTMA